MVLEVISLAISSISVLVAVITFLITHNRTKKVETIQQLDSIFDRYYTINKKSINELYMPWVALLSKVERFAAAYNGGILDKTTVKKRASTFLCKLYDERLEKLIEDRRDQFHKPDYYMNTEMMIKTLRSK